MRAHFFDVLIAVAKAPPHRFAGGGMWEAMHGDMTGYYEVRVTGPGRHQYRLFCLLEAEPPGPDQRPVLVILTGLDKPFGTTFSPADYRPSEPSVRSTAPECPVAGAELPQAERETRR